MTSPSGIGRHEGPGPPPDLATSQQRSYFCHCEYGTPQRLPHSPINVVHEVNQNDTRHDQTVNLSPQLLLNDQLIFCQLTPMHTLLVCDLPLLTHHVVVVELFRIHLGGWKCLMAVGCEGERGEVGRRRGLGKLSIWGRWRPRGSRLYGEMPLCGVSMTV